MSSNTLQPPFSGPQFYISKNIYPFGKPHVTPHYGGGGSEPEPSAQAMWSLPVVFEIREEQQRLFLVDERIGDFVKFDLSVARLNAIHSVLWMAGRPMRARPLQRQLMMGMTLVPTDRADFHLLKYSGRILIKPLPDYLLDHAFWMKYICEDKETYEDAAGFLMSFIWLVRSELDLKLAQEHKLVSERVKWDFWREFVGDVMKHIDINTRDQVNERYHLGELRLSRVNMIYRSRFFFTHFIRGYLYGYNRYALFFQRNFSWVIGVFVYISIILSAMQVGTGVSYLSNSTYFQRASYVFVVFSILVVMLFLVVVGGVFSAIFMFNTVEAIRHFRKDALARRKRMLDSDREKG